MNPPTTGPLACPSLSSCAARLDLGYCELRFRPDAKLVSVIRRFVTEFYEETLLDRDGMDRVALATHELLENAVKYSSDGEATLRIEVVSVGSRAVVSIRTHNRTTPENARALRALLDELDSSGDPFEAYQEVMRRSLLQGAGSRLGLARLRAEADVRVVLEPAPSDEVRVLGITEVDRGATP